MAYISGRDRYVGGGGVDAPARMAALVAPHDTNDLPQYAKALYIGVAGDLTIVPAGDTSANGTSVLFTNVPVGWFPVQVRRVLDTGTDADEIVAVYD
jgi:hypothetical protein